MKKLAVTAFLSLAALGFLTPPPLGWCCKGCCSSCYQICYAQPNAFSPFCPTIRPCCGCCCPKICCPKVCCPPPPQPCCEPCPPPCGPCAGGSCAGGGPALPAAAPPSGPSSAPSTMPPANGNSNYVPPMPMPTTQANPYAPMMGYPMTGYPMVQPVGYPPSYPPTMMGSLRGRLWRDHLRPSPGLLEPKLSRLLKPDISHREHRGHREKRRKKGNA